MNYKRIHDEIILNRRQNPLPNDVYGERHHVIPKSLGGNNTKENLVRLTAREHFIVHLLLVRMYPKHSIERHKMLWAVKRMRTGKPSKNTNRSDTTSRLYEYHRLEFSEMMREVNKTRPRTKEWRDNISAAKRGKPRTAETVEKMRIGSKLRWESEEYREKQAKVRIGRTLSDEHRKNIGLGQKDRKQSLETKAKSAPPNEPSSLLDKLRSPLTYPRIRYKMVVSRQGGYNAYSSCFADHRHRACSGHSRRSRGLCSLAARRAHSARDAVPE